MNHSRPNWTDYLPRATSSRHGQPKLFLSIRPIPIYFLRAVCLVFYISENRSNSNRTFREQFLVEKNFASYFQLIGFLLLYVFYYNLASFWDIELILVELFIDLQRVTYLFSILYISSFLF